MNTMRLVIYADKELKQILEFADVVTAQDIINALRRKPATTAISQALLKGETVKIEGRGI